VRGLLRDAALRSHLELLGAMSEKVVIVTGSRIWTERRVIFAALGYHQPELVVHGACHEGADTIAELWAKREEVDYLGMPAWWQKSGQYDNGAGPKRNQRMLERFPGALVLAFPLGEARGTNDCIARARKLGHYVVIYDETGKVR
jgi:hypothetical protein